MCLSAVCLPESHVLQKERLEGELAASQDEKKALSLKLQQSHHDKLELEQNIHKYELELTVSQQKNKTCQQEVRPLHCHHQVLRLISDVQIFQRMFRLKLLEL